MNSSIELEINQALIEDPSQGNAIMITPPIGEDYWIFRVNVYKDQYVQAFPKFGTIGIGFSKEEDWNCNLPYTQDAERIAEHIWHNRLYKKITKKALILGIKILQFHCEELDNNPRYRNE